MINLTSVKWLRLKNSKNATAQAKVDFKGGVYYVRSDERGTPMPPELAEKLLSESPGVYEECNSEWHKERRAHKDAALRKKYVAAVPDVVKNLIEEKVAPSKKKEEPTVPVVGKKRR